MNKLKIGVVSFTDPRGVKGIAAIDRYNMQCQERLVKGLRVAGFEVFAPLKEPVRSRAAAMGAAAKLQAANVQALALGCWKWTDPMLTVDVVRRVNKPVCLAGEQDEASTALGCMAAVGAALWEIVPNEAGLHHARVLGAPGYVAQWARGAAALSWLREKSILLWGGSYCLKMAHLDDDPSCLKSFLIGDILVEDQYHLIAGAEKILKAKKSRADDFTKWLKQNGAKFTYDKKMLTPESLRRQAALYLAARERLSALEDEDIAGVSVKCQPALSEAYGVTGCMLPAFLPFGDDNEGARPVIAATCEGDIKGLITSLMLQRISGVPPGFGDIRNIKVDDKDCLIISNCGAASVYYAALSKSTGKTLPALRFAGQCQGASGSAVGYSTPAFGAATIARLARINGEYIMQYMRAESVEVTPAIIRRLGWGDVWPVSLFDIGMDAQAFASAAASNHFSFVPGDITIELKALCDQAGIEMHCLNE